MLKSKVSLLILLLVGFGLNLVSPDLAEAQRRKKKRTSKKKKIPKRNLRKPRMDLNLMVK